MLKSRSAVRRIPRVGFRTSLATYSLRKTIRADPGTNDITFWEVLTTVLTLSNGDTFVTEIAARLIASTDEDRAMPTVWARTSVEQRLLLRIEAPSNRFHLRFSSPHQHVVVDQ
ncbi:MAG: hypothetical protein A3H97_20230 [Acidobacteria bacterium RIFCSPLOWO2_02_FULL_65_29]|nr:MAG: hypothetical protein A3H97_20230 [Acidobacteria bacterium RIFCSPLOWO2_02_FULL_65_29]